MENILNKTLEKLDGYLLSIERNVETSMYELKVGFKPNWVYKPNEDVNCDVESETEHGKIVTISGAHGEVVIDDLIKFVNKVVDHNLKIEKKRKEFDEMLLKKKEEIEKEIEEFQQKLEEEEENFDVVDDEASNGASNEASNGAKNDISNIEDEEVPSKINS